MSAVGHTVQDILNRMRHWILLALLLRQKNEVGILVLECI